jgi:hypothetical protein
MFSLQFLYVVWLKTSMLMYELQATFITTFIHLSTARSYIYMVDIIY